VVEVATHLDTDFLRTIAYYFGSIKSPADRETAFETLCDFWAECVISQNKRRTEKSAQAAEQRRRRRLRLVVSNARAVETSAIVPFSTSDEPEAA
jgi:hypothetical protein